MKIFGYTFVKTEKLKQAKKVSYGEFIRNFYVEKVDDQYLLSLDDYSALRINRKLFKTKKGAISYVQEQWKEIAKEGHKAINKKFENL